MKNKLIDEIKEFLEHSETWDKESVINDECVKGIDEIKGKSLDELSVTGLDENDKEAYIVSLGEFAEQVFDNCIRLFCNVLDSYRDK